MTVQQGTAHGRFDELAEAECRELLSAKSVGRLGTVIAPVLIGWGLSVGITEMSIMSLFAVPALVAAASLVVIALASAGRQSAVAEPAATMR